MADMQKAIGLGRESGDDAFLILTGFQAFGNQGSQEIGRLFSRGLDLWVLCVFGVLQRFTP